MPGAVTGTDGHPWAPAVRLARDSRAPGRAELPAPGAGKAAMSGHVSARHDRASRGRRRCSDVLAGSIWAALVSASSAHSLTPGDSRRRSTGCPTESSPSLQTVEERQRGHALGKESGDLRSPIGECLYSQCLTLLAFVGAESRSTTGERGEWILPSSLSGHFEAGGIVDQDVRARAVTTVAPIQSAICRLGGASGLQGRPTGRD